MTKYQPKQIRTLRRRAKLTQPAMASELGVTTQTVKNWEAGRRGIAPRYHAQLGELLGTAPATTHRPNARPRYADLDVGDWAGAQKYGWCEPKYDGVYCELRGGPDGWTVTGRTGTVTASGAAPMPVCHLLCEHIVDTEWARESGLYGRYIAWAALSACGNHLSRLRLESLVRKAERAGVDVSPSERHAIAAASTLWDYAVIKRGWEGIVLRTAGGRCARMKHRVTMDYVCTGSNGDSLIGALHNKRGKLIDKVSVPCPDEPRPGQVFEASGLSITASGSLRNPRFERWRDDKPAAECTT